MPQAVSRCVLKLQTWRRPCGQAKLSEHLPAFHAGQMRVPVFVSPTMPLAPAAAAGCWVLAF